MQFWKLMPSALSALSLACAAIAGPIVLRGNSTVATPSAGDTRALFLKQILAKSSDYGDFSNCSSNNDGKLKIGIVGAGAAGLYAATLLDSLGIDYEILESNSRIGGRIFTHRFDRRAWDASKPGEPDYYDYHVRRRHANLSWKSLTLEVGRRSYEIPRHGVDGPNNWKSQQLAGFLHQLQAQTRVPADQDDPLHISSQQHLPSLQR
jgi:hypothetical protein